MQRPGRLQPELQPVGFHCNGIHRNVSGRLLPCWGFILTQRRPCLDEQGQSRPYRQVWFRHRLGIIHPGTDCHVRFTRIALTQTVLIKRRSARQRHSRLLQVKTDWISTGGIDINRRQHRICRECPPPAGVQRRQTGQGRVSGRVAAITGDAGLQQPVEEGRRCG